MIAYTHYPIDARVRREAETLAQQGFRVRCLTTSQAGVPATTTWLNDVEVQQLPVAKYRGKSQRAYLASYLAFLFVSSLKCIGFLLKGELDVVHVHNLPNFLVFAGLVPRMLGRSVVLDIHDSVPETFATKFAQASALWKVLCFEERMCAAVAHRVICVNQPQRDVLVQRGIPKRKTFVSMNVPDPSIFGDSEEARAPRSGEGYNLVYHGTMVNRLGVDLVIEAVARLRARRPGVRLHLWGHGDDLERFRQLARTLDVEDLVQFRPEGYPLDALPAHLRGMDIGVVGNRRSAAADLMLPVKLMEYVALGIPAVVPRLRTIEHYFSPDMVSFFEPEDADSLADAIDRLCREPALRDRQARLARTFLTTYGWQRQGPDLVRMYEGLVAGSRQQSAEAESM